MPVVAPQLGTHKSRERLHEVESLARRTVANATTGDSLGCKSEEAEPTRIQSRNATTGVIARIGGTFTLPCIQYLHSKSEMGAIPE